MLANHISDVREDAHGNIWVCDGKLSLLDPSTDTFIHFDNPQINNWHAVSLYCENGSTFWVGPDGNGFSQFELTSKTFKNYKVNHPEATISGRSNVIRAINQDAEGNIWLGTYGGLVKFETKTEKITHWIHDDLNPNSLSHNSIWDLVPTTDGKIWIATWGGGVNYFDTKTSLFENKTFQKGGLYSMNSLEFPSLFNDGETIWFGSNAKGIFGIKPIHSLAMLSNTQALVGKEFRKVIKGKQVTYFISDQDGLFAHTNSDGVVFVLPPWRDKKPNGLSGNRVSSISEAKSGELYIGTDFGLTVYDPQSKKIRYFLNDQKDSTSLSHNTIMATHIDSKDRLWLATASGLDLYLPKTNSFAYWRKQIYLAGNPISLGETSDGLWIGTITGGLNLFNVENKTAKVFQYDEKNDSSISNNYISKIYTDSKNDLWLGTRQGLNRYNRVKQNFERFDIAEEAISDIAKDGKGNLIVRADQNLYQLSSEGNAKPKQLLLPLGTIGWRWSSLENAMYLFADKEIAKLPLDSLNANTAPTAIAITSFQLDPNNKHPLDSSEAQLSPSHRKDIVLDYDQNLFSIEFAVLDFTNSSAIQYAYQLEGFDEDWTYSETRRYVTYTNLSPGNYTFRAKGSNSSGVWNEQGASLAITILPPPWKTWWAYSGYIFAFMGLLYFARRVTVNRERLKAQVLIEQKEKQTLQELDHLKTKFFSNITHEFRTPLTLIQGPANELLEKEQNPESKQLLNMIRSNSNRLLKLINQMLDLAKLDAREMKLSQKPTNLALLINVAASQFTSLATSKKIQYTWHIAQDLPNVIADSEKIEAILSNLLSNAIKFTDSGGIIHVNASWAKNSLLLRVSDSGRGIPQEKLKHIFDRFYQVNATDSSHSEGTGIGLALVKEYTELMKGILEVESKEGLGTTFNIQLPLETTPYTEELSGSAGIETSHYENSTVLTETEKGQHPLILLVEDNTDIRQFIKTCLGDRYQYKEAQHGKEGLVIARDEVPDMIISDWMMPEMDGVEFCKQIKKDPRTDHIPFIMLTAKATNENKIEGLQTGADEYLIKPFNKDELVLKVQNLITLRERLHVHIKHNLLANATLIQATSVEEKFIMKAKAFVEAHIADENLSVEMLSVEMALSREQCYRKIIALTGLSPSAFIRKLRLQKAAQLLAAKSDTVSQIAYQTGFGNLSHFSKAFKEEFGKLPSEYAE